MKQLFLFKPMVVMFCLFQSILGIIAYGQSIGELAWLTNGNPAMMGQATQDHFFVRGDYDDTGTMVTYDNVISFKSGAMQTIWFYLNDDEIYQNEAIQSLTPIAYNSAGDLYNEITYNSFQLDVYLPEGLEFIINDDDEQFVQGDRMPNTSNLTIGYNGTKVIDGKNYTSYRVVVYNSNAYGSHLSARTAGRYRQYGALKKDYTVFGLYIKNNNQAIAEGQIDDIILGYMIMNIRETAVAGWSSNEGAFFYGTGGNNETQRFMLYNRVKTYGSNGINNSSSTILATSISLNTSNLILGVNETSQLSATISPSNATNKTVSWKSNNTSIAKVNSNGLVTAISPGTAVITATTTDGSNLSSSCRVTVQNVLATSISLNTTSMTLDMDESSQLVANIYPSNATNKTVRWTSGNTSIATVNSDGVVTAISPGMVNITATTTDGSNLSATCSVTVNERKATSISLNKSSLSLYVYQTAQLTATVYPSDTGNKTVSWTSSNPSVATVNSNGLVTAVSAGNATIKATTTDGSNLSATCSVTVSIIPATSISLNKSSLTLDINDNYQLVATITPTNVTYNTVTWKSSNNAIATVSSNGVVTPKAPGNVRITATTTDGTNLSASCQITVVKLVTSITLSENNLTLILPEGAQLMANIIPIDATNKTLNWTSSNNSVATVDNNGNITPIAVGYTTIRATTTDGSNLSASCSVTVKKQLVTSISLNDTLLVMHMGETAQLIADILPANATNKTLTWSTGNTSVARVDNNGLVTAIAGGTTFIKASTTDGSYLSANCAIEVLPDYYITLDTLSHIRGAASQVMDLPVTLVNKNPISGIQFDVTLPSSVGFNLIDGLPDIWLDEARSTRTHSAIANRLSNGSYRVLVTSSSSKNLKGNDGVLIHMNLVLPQMHNTGNNYVNISNIIASEADETRHTLDPKSAKVSYYYMVGDADANAVVDIADHTATASKILGKSPSPFYYDAANVDGNNSLDVVDLVGITNIALEIKPITVRQAPARNIIANRLFCDKLKFNAAGEAEVNIGIDCGFDFAGFQMDMDLPNGLTLMDASLGEMASRLELVAEVIQDGKVRLLGTSFSDAVVSGDSPELLKLKITAGMNYMQGANIEFSDILFAERDMTGHYLDGALVEYIEPSSVYELMEEARIYVENGNIVVDTPIAGKVQMIAVDGRVAEYPAHVGHNVYAVGASGFYIIHFNGKTLKIKL